MKKNMNENEKKERKDKEWHKIERKRKERKEDWLVIKEGKKGRKKEKKIC